MLQFSDKIIQHIHSGLRGTTLPTSIGQYFDDKKSRSKINETSIELFGFVPNQVLVI